MVVEAWVDWMGIAARLIYACRRERLTWPSGHAIVLPRTITEPRRGGGTHAYVRGLRLLTAHWQPLSKHHLLSLHAG